MDGETLYHWTLAALPKELSQQDPQRESDASPINPLLCYSLEGCREAFEESVGKKMVWPPFLPPDDEETISMASRDIYNGQS